MWCWLVANAEAIRAVILFVGLLGGGVGLYIARQRYLIADRNLLRERWQTGMELLSIHPERYTARVAGAAILSGILLDSESTEYDSSILRAFEAFLYSPPSFGLNFKNSGYVTDYESRDTFIVVTALRQYVNGGNAQPLLSIPSGLPFTIIRNTVEPNKGHHHYRKWIEMRGQPPEYDDQPRQTS